ncbi:hypothetical protein KCU85_g113, partial [Aureobasidium melanogenum]
MVLPSTLKGIDQSQGATARVLFLIVFTAFIHQFRDFLLYSVEWIVWASVSVSKGSSKSEFNVHIFQITSWFDQSSTSQPTRSLYESSASVQRLIAASAKRDETIARDVFFVSSATDDLGGLSPGNTANTILVGVHGLYALAWVGETPDENICDQVIQVTRAVWADHRLVVNAHSDGEDEERRQGLRQQLWHHVSLLQQTVTMLRVMAELVATNVTGFEPDAATSLVFGSVSSSGDGLLLRLPSKSTLMTSPSLRPLGQVTPTSSTSQILTV